MVGENKIWGSKSTHLVMNFTIGEKKVSNALSSQDFITQKDKEGLVNSRDITAEQELTLVYSTFDTN